jgi:hypothetical protein
MDRQALNAACGRLEDDYGPRMIAAGASGVGSWANSTSLGFEVRFGNRAGGMWQTYVKYARRARPVFGRAVAFRSIEAAETELRQELDEFIAQLERGERPQARGIWLGLGGSKH